MTKHSATLQQSNPLIMQSQGGAAAATNTGSAAPFNVTGVNPNPAVANVAAPASLAVNNVKRVWGAASTEEVKAPEPDNPGPVTSHVNTHYGGQSNLNQAAAQPISTSTRPSAVKTAPQESQAEKKRKKAAAKLFGGISGQRDGDSSDSDSNSNTGGSDASTPTKVPDVQAEVAT